MKTLGDKKITIAGRAGCCAVGGYDKNGVSVIRRKEEGQCTGGVRLWSLPALPGARAHAIGRMLIEPEFSLSWSIATPRFQRAEERE